MTARYIIELEGFTSQDTAEAFFRSACNWHLQTEKGEGARLIDTLSPLPGQTWPGGEPVRGSKVVAALNFGEE